MFTKFIQESLKEFDHVVWPTHKETKKYFTIVTGVIVAFAIFLFVVGSSLSWGLFTAKNTFAPSTATVSNEAAKNLDLKDLNLQKNVVSTGATASGVTASGAQTASGQIVVPSTGSGTN